PVLFETVQEPLELVPLEPRPLSDAGERHRAVRREESPHDRLEGVRHLRMGWIERDVQVARGPSVPLEATDHVYVVVEFVQGLLDLFPLRADLRVDRPEVHPVPFANHVEDFLLEVAERAPREGGEEERHVLRTDVPHAAVQEAALEDVAGLPPPQPFLVVEAGRVIVDVEDHAGLEETVEVVVEGLDVRELLLEQEGLHLILVEHLARLVLPLKALEVAGHPELEFYVDQEVPGRHHALGLELPKDLLDEPRLHAQCDAELLRTARSIATETATEDL